MRVEADEFQRIRDDVIGNGRPYDAENLEGATLDGGFALAAEGFTAPTITETGEPERMVLYASRPDWRPATETAVIERLEHGWERIGAFRHEAHSITVAGDVVALDFVTWWDGGAFYMAGWRSRSCARVSGGRRDQSTIPLSRLRLDLRCRTNCRATD